MTETEALSGAGSHQQFQESPDQTFEELMDALEALTDRLATGDMGIEQAAELYEQAEALHARARLRLAEVQERIARLAPGTDPPVDNR